MTSNPPTSGGVIPSNGLPPVPEWIEHDSWLAVRRQLKEEYPKKFARRVAELLERDIKQRLSIDD